MNIFHNIKGEVIKRTPFDYPYSYDAYETYKSYNWSKDDTVTYSDRLIQWDSNKFLKCAEKAFGLNCGHNFNKNPKDIEKFLNLYFEIELELTGVEQACNYHNGYPYWIFYYKSKKK